jgi:hypothetical protein
MVAISLSNKQLARRSATEIFWHKQEHSSGGMASSIRAKASVATIQ